MLHQIAAAAADLAADGGGPPPLVRPDGRPPRAIARRLYLHLHTVLSASRWADRARAKLRHKTSLERASTVNLVSQVAEGEEVKVAYQLQANAELNTLEAFGKETASRKRAHPAAVCCARHCCTPPQSVLLLSRGLHATPTPHPPNTP